MKLYFSPGACSLSPHIALREAGLAFDLVRVDLRTKRMQDGSDFREVNPKGYVPALELDDGQLLTEGLAIVQYIADQKPESKLAPQAGTLERYRLQEWLSFIATELHKNFSPLFDPTSPEATREASKSRLASRFDLVEKQLEKSPYLLGDDFTAADAYLFTVLRWPQYLGIDMAKWPALQGFVERVSTRPAVQAALQAEGVKK